MANKFDNVSFSIDFRADFSQVTVWPLRAKRKMKEFFFKYIYHGYNFNLIDDIPGRLTLTLTYSIGLSSKASLIFDSL